MITVVVLRLGWGNNSGDDGYLFICSFIYSFFFSADTHSFVWTFIFFLHHLFGGSRGGSEDR